MKTPSSDAASSDVNPQTAELQTPPVQSVNVGGGNGELFGAAPFETFRKRLVDATSFDELQAVSAEIDGACRQGDFNFDDERERAFSMSSIKNRKRSNSSNRKRLTLFFQL